MSEKKIVVKINEDGMIFAETQGFIGTECAAELDKLLKDLARLNERRKKPEFFQEKEISQSNVKIKNNNG